MNQEKNPHINSEIIIIIISSPKYMTPWHKLALDKTRHVEDIMLGFGKHNIS